MTTQKGTTKEAIVEAAIALFYAKGYKGTTIRDIASEAKINPANISYYFKGKQGLLEECLIRFFEPYLACLEEETGKLEKDQADHCLKRAIKRVLVFQSEHKLLARFVWREISIDSQTSREIISSYLMKERFFLKNLIQATLKEQKMAFPISMLIIQLKGILMMPYVNSLYVSEVWGMGPHEPYFIDKYHLMISKWLESWSGNQTFVKPIESVASNHY
ncbi:forespore capture DNA-binding protein RefZ [Lederbergia galactosidilytica]|uniref:Transcriptional regulator n=1 Tax=Lederbergia galactosidilytica TaxID=217031 RepID=A0A177ZJR3_9BACI|nr:forespore capture DNA-binding protein RefZ [Lederbergia galactosidilytica]KRG14554.1 transcriptional regulator [Virgibacillus soli]MBP1915367.1 AcrR family transcriptional regulator [Lederbergia galactosidilytica]OAK68182.1 transcriptional regulator [Lederbergia galactosidilytica]